MCLADLALGRRRRRVGVTAAGAAGSARAPWPSDVGWRTNASHRASSSLFSREHLLETRPGERATRDLEPANLYTYDYIAAESDWPPLEPLISPDRRQCHGCAGLVAGELQGRCSRPRRSTRSTYRYADVAGEPPTSTRVYKNAARRWARRNGWVYVDQLSSPSVNESEGMLVPTSTSRSPTTRTIRPPVFARDTVATTSSRSWRVSSPACAS